MKSLNAWVKAHPYKAILFACGFCVIAAALPATNELGMRYGIILFVLLLILWAGIFCGDVRKLSLLLILAISTSESHAADPPVESVGGVAVGVVVICVGGYCVYKTVKFCQRKFPKEAGNTNGAHSFVPTADGESAASWNYGAIGSCDPTLTPGPDFLVQETAGLLFAVDVRIDDAGNVTVNTSALSEGGTQGWAEFQAEVARHGIQITGNPDNSQYFSTNRIACTPSDVAISFDASTGTVDMKDSGGPVKLIEIQRSRDLQHWSSFLRTRVGAGGRGLRIEDATTAGSMFYRVNVSEP